MKKIKTTLRNIRPGFRKNNISTKTEPAAFTLVELIIVIAIIAILAVAAFMMLTKWLSSSRDSRRLSDVSTIQKALEIDYTVLGHYPDPDGKRDIMDMTGNLMWYMGYIGEDLIEKIDSLNKAPVDPSDSSNYNYAVTLDNQEYQLGAFLENGEEVFKFLNSTYAIQRELTEDDLGIVDIDGNYDGIVSYPTDNSIYIIKTESLLVRSGNYVDTYSDDTDEKITTTEVTNLLVDGKRIGEKAIIMDINIPNGADNDRAIRTSKTELGLSGGNIEGDKQAIIILEDEIKEDFVPIQYKYCTLGSTEISHGYTIDTYSSSTVPFDSSCEDIKITRLCDDGTLSEGYENQSCVMEGAQDCDLDGTAVGHGESITAYQTSSIEWNSGDTCVGLSQERVCYNGTLDGSYTNLVCSKGEANNCDANSSYDYINNNGDTHRYDVPALNHGESDTPTVDVEENNGTYKYTLSVTCNDGTYNESETAPVLVDCDANYTANGEICEADDRVQTCDGTLASNEEWNTSDTYTQIWDGSQWTPTKTANYDENPSIDDCRYRCKVNYTWNGSSCDANTKPVTCSGTIPTNATASTETTYTQTWNGSAWAPTISWTEGASTCGFSCNLNYTWNGTSCEADGKTETCGGSLPTNAGWNNSNTYGQIWNGSDWEPIKTANYSLTTSSDDCRYACLTGNHTEDSGTTCISNTRSCAITNGTGSQDWEGGNSGTASDWGTCTVVSCDTNYSISGNVCAADTKSVSCEGSIPENASATTLTTYSQIWDGSVWTPTISWTEGESTCGFSCDEHYTWNGTSCVADTQTVVCGSVIPANSERNTSNDYVQTRNGSVWAPTKSANYNITSSTDDCRFKCKANYTWNGTSCVANTKIVTCGGTLPANSGWNTSNNYIQTRNGSAWVPTKTANYNIASSTNDCRYACSTGNHTENSGTSCVSNTRSCTITNGTGSQDWEGGNSGAASDWGTCTVVSCNANYSISGNSCVADTKTVTCGGTLPSNSQRNTSNNYIQTRNGSAWAPNKTANYNIISSTNDCRYICSTGYHTENSGTTCVANTRSCTITNGAGSQTWNGSSRSTCNPTGCGLDFYASGGSCIAVGIGYYSADGSSTRTACSNYPDTTSRNYTYTSDGNGTNSCTATYTQSCGVDLYETANGTCSAVGVGYYSAASSNTRTACSNYPDTTSRNYTYTSDGNGTNSCTATYTQSCGVDLYETVNGTCSAVGIGYYSAASSNTRTACSNYPDTTSRDYTYTSDGNGTNSCTATYTQLCGVDLYETTNGTCSAVGVAYYSPSSNNTRTACTNKPSNSSYTGDGNGTNSCTWSCNTNYTQSGSSCVYNYKKSCKELYDSGNTSSGVKTIDQDGDGGASPMNVYCYNGDGGGWTLAIVSNNGNNSLLKREAAYGNISNTSSSFAKLSEEAFNDIMTYHQIRFVDNSGTKWYYLYNSNTYYDLDVIKSYNVRLKRADRSRSPRYNTHNHFILFTGISKDIIPSGCGYSYNRYAYGTYLGTRYQNRCQDSGLASWTPRIYRASSPSTGNWGNASYKVYIK